ncbi:Uma2 family endonuclease [Nonomuraea rhizosphaerae]|uniref:Uma2 family endonuclease n=1 Tax=Nonomuraea rhizosphaerae TaxID=2665663 RepID=UPI001C5EEA22|nr:Uma2 family endonuclease [Nonomuraea rhizosphaerae]
MPFTVDDLLALPDDGYRYELFDGSLLVSPAPAVLHQRVVGQLLYVLGSAAPPEMEPLPPVNVRVGDRDCYIPDVVVVPSAAVRSMALMVEPGQILLAVEVVSSCSRSRDRHLKTAAYAAAGIPAYWRVEVDEGPVLHVHELDGDSYGTPTTHRAGTPAAPAAPFPVSFDPAYLLEQRSNP